MAADQPCFPGSEWLDLKLCRKRDCRLDRASNRAPVRMEGHGTIDGLALPFEQTLLDPQPVADVYPLDHQHAIFLLDLADRFCSEVSLSRRYLARFQRASECAGESTGGRGDQVIDRRCMRGPSRNLHPVMLGDLRMNVEPDRFTFRRHKGTSQRPLDALNSYSGAVCDLVCQYVLRLLPVRACSSSRDLPPGSKPGCSHSSTKTRRPGHPAPRCGGRDRA